MQTKITLKGTLVMIDYCSQSKKDEDGDFNFNEFYYQTAGFLDWEDGGLFVNDDTDNDLMKQKGKYVKTKEHFHHLFREDGEHPLPVELHTRHYRCIEADYIIEHEDEFDTGQKIALIRQMIEKVVISKQDRNHAVAKVYPKVGSFIYIFEMDVYRKITTMRSEMLK